MFSLEDEEGAEKEEKVRLREDKVNLEGGERRRREVMIRKREEKRRRMFSQCCHREEKEIPKKKRKMWLEKSGQRRVERRGDEGRVYD